jgi:hypothetical protein
LSRRRHLFLKCGAALFGEGTVSPNFGYKNLSVATAARMGQFNGKNVIATEWPNIDYEEMEMFVTLHIFSNPS